MTEPQAAVPQLDVRYSTLRDRAEQAARQGELGAALEHSRQAWQLARESGDRVLADRAFCNLAAIRIELRDGAEAVPELRQILLRNSDPENCRLAAYNISRALELGKDFKKALFYARIARDRSQQLERRDWLASSHNLIANCLIAQSFFAEAQSEYRRALELLGEPAAPRSAEIESNLGYCLMVLGLPREAFPLMLGSLRRFRRSGGLRGAMICHLDLCYAHLEIGRYRHAERHGRAALALAERLEHGETLKNALYLLGETAQLLGDSEGAEGYFARLQRHFPETPFLVDFLLAIDVRKMINLRA